MTSGLAVGPWIGQAMKRRHVDELDIIRLDTDGKRLRIKGRRGASDQAAEGVGENPANCDLKRLLPSCPSHGGPAPWLGSRSCRRGSGFGFGIWGCGALICTRPCFTPRTPHTSGFTDWSPRLFQSLLRPDPPSGCGLALAPCGGAEAPSFGSAACKIQAGRVPA